MFIDVAKIVFLFINTKLYMEKSDDFAFVYCQGEIAPPCLQMLL